jgi:hypothetical protein
MVDTSSVATSTATRVENGALPQCCELTTCRAHVNELVRDDFEELVDYSTWYPEGRELGMHISVCHCGTADSAVACASGTRQRCHLGLSVQAVINCLKGIIVEAEEGHRVFNPVHCAPKVTLLMAARVVDAHLLHFESHPGRGIWCELVDQREVDDCAHADLVTLVWQHAALPEGARHIDLLTEVVHWLL